MKEKPAVSMVKNILQRKKNSTKFIFKQILNTVFGVFLKIDTRSHGLVKQNAIDRYSQPKEIRTRRLGRIGVEPSRQKCLRVLINLIELQKF